jgi:hypothetical protein
MTEVQTHPRNLWRAPAILLGVAIVLYVVALALDTGGERSRDLALLIGVPTLYLLLPVAVVWLVIALVLHLRRR